MLKPFHFSYAFESETGKRIRNVTYPFKLPNAAAKFSLKIWIPKSVGSVHCAKLSGLKIAIHSGSDMPRFDRNVYYFPLNHIGEFYIHPNVVETDESLIENYDPKQRKCVADNDKALTYFKKYTQSNCELDRTIENFIRKSNCSLFWQPHFNGTKICDFGDYTNYSNLKYKNNLIGNCLPACNHISYEAQRSSQNYFNSQEYNIVGFRMGFTHQRYFTYRRSELYTLNGFISNCGGILSLCMGVSIMSVIEIVYSGTLRAFCDWRRTRKSLKHKAVLANQRNIQENAIESTSHGCGVTKKNVSKSKFNEKPENFEMEM